MKKILFALCCSFLLLSGCAHFGGTAPPDDYYWLKSGPGKTAPSGRAGALLLYADYVRNLSGADYAQELDRVRQMAGQDNSAYRQLQYALALTAPGGDMRRAQQVVDGVIRDGSSREPELYALAMMMGANLAERRRLEARLEAGAKHTDELEKKVEAVKNIEKTMIERSKSGIEKP